MVPRSSAFASPLALSSRRAAFVSLLAIAVATAGAQKAPVATSGTGTLPLPGATTGGQVSRAPIAGNPGNADPQSRFVSAIASSTMVNFTVALQPRDLAGLQAFADSVSDPSSPNYRHFITPKEVGDRYGASTADRQAVVAYLASKGITVNLVADSGLAIIAQGTAANVQNAFGTTLANYQGPDALGNTIAYQANTTTLTLPTTIANVVTYVSGIDTSIRAQKRTPTATLTPQLISAAYSIAPSMGAGFRGAGRNVAISNFDGFRFTNSKTYVSYFGLPYPAAGIGTNVTQTIISGYADGNAQSAYGEGDLDIQMVVGQAPLSNIRIYTGVANANKNNETADRLATITQEAQDNWADVITESYGWGTNTTQTLASQIALINSWHAIQLQFNAQGETYMAASGDSSTHIGPYAYPDYDPEVLMVGGAITTVDDTTTARLSEIAWNYSGGGWYNSYPGITFNTLPSWQKGTGVPTNINRRLIPDVAFQAGANNSSSYSPGGVYVIVNNGTGLAQFDGTSCASPILAGMLGTLESRLYASNTDTTRPRLGRLQDLIYSQNGRSDVYNDITSGTGIYTLPADAADTTNVNNTFGTVAQTAGLGWDFMTGWGSINMEGFYQSILPTASIAVTLGNYSGDVTQVPVTVQFRLPGTTTVVSTQTVYPSASGMLSLKAPGVGTYDVSMKASHWLRRTLTSQAFGAAGTTSMSATLINGDVNGDNYVTVADRSLVTSALGTGLGDAGYNANADLNGDGFVTAADRSIATSNLGAVGDN